MPSADRPMPVSRTANVSSTLPSACALRRHREHDLARLGELHRVAEQVQEDLAQPRHVADDRRRDVALEQVGGVEMLLDGARGDEVERRLDAFAQVERLRLDVHPAGLDLREIEDVVDDGEQRVAGLADRRDVVVLLVVERRVEQEPAHADHRVHRRADLVAHRREERALRLVGGLGLRARLPRFVEQPRVLDGDGGLQRESRQELELGVVERKAAGAPHRHRAPARSCPPPAARPSAARFPGRSVPGIWIARGSACVSLMYSARPASQQAADDADAGHDRRSP